MEGYARLLTRTEVAALFRVDPKTIGRWARKKWLTEIRTPGGKPRYRESEVRALLAASQTSGPVPNPTRDLPPAGPLPSSPTRKDQP